MNDDLIVVGAYPHTENRREILIKCLTQLKKIEKEILLVSHYPVGEEIYSLCNYYIYNSKNELMTGDDILPFVGQNSIYFYYTGPGIDIKCFNATQYDISFAVMKSIQSGFSYAKDVLKKECGFYLEGDCIISDDDLIKFDIVKNRVISKNKMAYFQRNTNFDSFSTVFFFIDLEYLFSRYKFARTKDEYMDIYKSRYQLEATFYDTFNNDALIETDNNIHTVLSIFSEKTLINCTDSLEDTPWRFQRSGIVIEEKTGDLYLYSVNFDNKKVEYRYVLSVNYESLENENTIVGVNTYILEYKNQYYIQKLINIDDINSGIGYDFVLKVDGVDAMNIKMNNKNKDLLRKHGYIKLG